MGFGLLFIGVFLLLNVGYYAYTDLVAGCILLYAEMKLARFDRRFRYAAWCAGAFSAVGLALFALEVAGYLAARDFTAAMPFLLPLRDLSLAGMLAFCFTGMKALAVEVDAKPLAARLDRAIPTTVTVLALNGIAECGILSVVPTRVSAYLYFFLIVAYIAVLAIDLVTIAKTYAQIGLPDEAQGEKRGGLLSSIEKHEEEKAREYAAWKLQKLSEKRRKKDE